MNRCPCGSGLKPEQCCSQYFEAMNAPTCETLMRSRYTAYVLGNNDYLRRTWHPDTCPESIGGTSLKWIGLEIVNTKAGMESDLTGEVTFIASFCDGSRGRRLHETSRFIREQGKWLYVDGEVRLTDIGRNDPCPCGSGLKFKRCCGR